MSAGAPPQTSLGELIAFPGLAGYKGPTSKKGEGFAEGEGTGRKGNETGWKRR